MVDSETPSPHAQGRRPKGSAASALPEGHVGRWIDQLIPEHGITAAGFTRLIEVSQQEVFMYRRGKRSVPRSFVEKIVTALQLDTTVADIQSEFPVGHTLSRRRGVRGSAATRGQARAAREPGPRGKPQPPSTQPSLVRVRQEPISITDASSDEAFEAHLDRILHADQQGSLVDMGWPRLGALLRRARVNAGHTP